MIATIVLAFVMGGSIPELNAIDHESGQTSIQEYSEELDTW